MSNKARLKGATRLLIHDLGGLEAAHTLTGISVSQLGRYQNVGADDFITVQIAAALESQSGVRPHVTLAMAALGGHILVPRPENSGSGKWAAHLAATVKEAGDVLSEFGKAIANDGDVSPDEAEHLIVEVDQALSALMAFRRELERQVSLGKAPPG